MPTEQEILSALARVPGPDGQTPLPQSGALAGIAVREGKVYASIAIDPKDAARLEPMRRNAEAVLKQMKGVAGAIVTLTADRPQGAGQGRSAAPAPAPHPHTHAAPAARSSTGVPGVKRIVAVASGKGGVGKSTVAANLALALAASGWRVGLLDADIYGPSVPKLFGVSGKPDLIGKLMKPHEAFGLKLMSIGFLVDEATAMIWRGPMAMSALNQLLREVAWGELDCLIVDMPPGTGDIQLSMSQGVPLAGAVVVSTPQDLALIDARRGIAMFQKVSVPVLGIVENMSYFVCPHCGGRSDIFAHGGARHEAERWNVPFLGEIPLALEIRENSDAGRPVVAVAPEGAHAQAFAAVAANVKASLEAGGALKPPPRIVIE